MMFNPSEESVLFHKMSQDYSSDPSVHQDWNRPVSTGTTLVAVEFKDGVVFGADSRTTSGSFVHNRVTDKLVEITDRVYCCRSGSAADTQAVTEIVRYHMNFYEMEMNERPQVKAVANVCRDMLYNYREQLLAGIIVGGWDKQNGGQIYSIPLGGVLLRRKFALGGSGSGYLYGYADSNYKSGMTKEESIDFVKNCLSMAISRDGSSGGVARIAAITESGVERFLFKPNQLVPLFKE